MAATRLGHCPDEVLRGQHELVVKHLMGSHLTHTVYMRRCSVQYLCAWIYVSCDIKYIILYAVFIWLFY